MAKARTSSPALAGTAAVLPARERRSRLAQPQTEDPPEHTFVRNVHIHWLTDPPRGHGRINVGSRAFMALRFSPPVGRAEPEVTDPSELFAAAHSSAVAVILARILDTNHTPAHELIVTATCVYGGDWYDLKAIEFYVQGRIPNIDSPQFDEAASSAVERYRRSFRVDARATVTVRTKLMQGPSPRLPG